MKYLSMKTSYLVLLLAAGLMASCDKQPEPSDPLDLSRHELKVLRQGNNFGFDLFSLIAKENPGKNLCVSPYSVYTALAMTANGANGQTMTEMLNVLGFTDKEVGDMNGSVKKLNESLIGKDPSTVFETANSVWYNSDGFEVYPGFVSAMGDSYSAIVEGIDFGSDKALPRVNGWVSDKTHGKIDEIISKINPDDVCFLINALYFNGKWTTVFDKKKTHEGSFRNFDGTLVTVPVMYLEDTIQAVINDDVTAVKLPYGDKSWSMYLFMPPAGTNPDTWSEDVLPKEWDNLRRSFVSVPGQELYLPQFKVESSLELGNQLKALGMPTAFGGAADFSKLGPGSLAISQVLHKTYIDVNEEGTEAAAVTAVIITRTSFPINQLRFNRPFVFVIAEEETGAILFVGKIVHL